MESPRAAGLDDRACSRGVPTSRIQFEGADGRRSARLEEVVPFDARLDRDVLAARVRMVSTLVRGATPFAGVRAVHDDEPAIAPPPAPRAIDDAIATVRTAVTDAVRRSIGGARRVAVLTGGGVDSSALLAMAVAHARETGGSAFGVALDFAGPGDDRPHLAALEAHLGCEIVRVRPEQAAHRAPLVATGVDASPLAWPGAAMEIEMLAEARRRGAELALMGVGADALFDGDPRDVGSVRGARTLRGFGAPRSSTFAWVVRPRLARRIPRGLREAIARRRAPAPPAWAGPVLRSFLVRHHERVVAWSFADRRAREDAPEREHLASLRHQESVASGLLRRDPYDDALLAATMQSIPRAWLLHGSMRRGLFRAAMRGLLPETLRLRTDKAEFEPAFTRFVEAAGGFDAFRDLARMTALGDLGLALPRPFERAFDELASRPRDSWGWGDVWPALAVEAFVRGRSVRS